MSSFIADAELLLQSVIDMAVFELEWCSGAFLSAKELPSHSLWRQSCQTVTVTQE
jgi:hypothetical protein